MKTKKNRSGSMYVNVAEISISKKEKRCEKSSGVTASWSNDRHDDNKSEKVFRQQEIEIKRDRENNHRKSRAWYDGKRLSSSD